MIKRAGGKSERFELIGLKTETEPLDYTETFLLGIGSLTLKSRLNKQIFTMKRVIGLYRIPLVFWKQPLIKRIDEMLSYQGKVLAVDPDERIDMAEAAADFLSCLRGSERFGAVRFCFCFFLTYSKYRSSSHLFSLFRFCDCVQFVPLKSRRANSLSRLLLNDVVLL